MKKKNTCRYCFWLLMSAAIIAAGTVNVFAEEVADLMVRPAMKSNLAVNSVLLSVVNTGKRLVAVGERGHILLSDDCGVSWRQANVPVSVTLTAVCFSSPQKGWAVGHCGVVLKTENGGESWIKSLDGIQAAALIMKAVTQKAQTGESASEQMEKEIAVAQRLVDEGPDKPFLDIYFENDQNGYIIGAYNFIFRTENGGMSWLPWLDNMENPDNLHLYGIRRMNSHIFVAGERGILLRSVDKGQTFESLLSPYEGSYFGLLPMENGELIIFGLRGKAYKSLDRGITWKSIDTGVSASISAATVLQDNTVVLVAQSGEVVISRDNGGTFNALPIEGRFPFTGITQAGNGNLVLVGVRGVRMFPIAPKRADSLKQSGGEHS
ncbi:MAG: YCF48-related protein [Pseudomonadota bacterium]